ncbi:hypothetical protein ACFY0F_03210 [Streptomyces sp. NPDC001544]|uniref:hypothetical protein n=1 Tax=Streptomyces sp. NPDC001544 TaxID=3364584 RepID=UPI00368E7E0C
MDDEEWQWELESRLAEREGLTARLLERSAMAEHRRRVVQGLDDALAGLPYESARTRPWPLPGAAPAWDVLAARVMFQFPGD